MTRLPLPVFIMEKDLARDSNLSWGARGFLAFTISYTDNHTFKVNYPDDIEFDDEMNGYRAELIDAGILKPGDDEVV